MATVQQILNTDLPQPTFSLRPSRLAPLPSGTSFNRGSAARSFGANRDIVQVSSGESRIFGPNQGLRLEPQRTQLLNNPLDVDAGFWSGDSISTNTNAGTAKGQSYTEVTMNTNNDKRQQSVSMSDGSPVSMSSILSGTADLRIQLRFKHSGGSYESVGATYDVSNGTVSDTFPGANQNLITARIEDLGGGYYWPKLSVEAGSNWQADLAFFFFQNASGDTYRWLHSQVEESRFVTTPISESIGTRNKDKFTILTDGRGNDEEETLLFELSIPAEKTFDNNRFLEFTDSNDKVNLSRSGSEYFFKYNDSSDGAGLAIPNTRGQAYEKSRFAISRNENELRMAHNGVSDTATTGYDGDGLGSAIKLSLFQIPLNLISATYSPKMLSTTDLETLTRVT